MSIDRNKVLEAAQKHLAKGNLDKAIAEFQKLMQADPRDVRTLLKIGELQAKKGAIREAVDTYLKVGDSYSTQGFYSKSIAVYKQAVKLDMTRVDAMQKLAQNYVDLQHIADALTAYDMLAQAYMSQSNVEGALAAMHRATELDGMNLAARIRYAEALSRAGKTKEAAQEFERGAKLIKQQGRMDDYIKVAERLLFHREDDLALAKELAELYLERNDGKRALAKLQLLFKSNPKDEAVLGMLAQAFVALDQKDKAIQVLKELAKNHHEANRADERLKIMRRVVELDPTDAEAKQVLAGGPAARPRVDIDAVVPPAAVIGGGGRGGVQPARGPVNVPAPGAAPSVPLPGAAARGAAPNIPMPGAASARMEAPAYQPDTSARRESAEIVVAAEPSDEEELLIIDDDSASMPPPAMPTVEPQSTAQARMPQAAEPPAAAPRASIPPAADPNAAIAQRDALVQRMLNECDVFARYRLKPRIIEQLEKILAIAPEHVEARTRLKVVFVEDGRIDDAIEQLLAIAELSKGTDRARAIASLQEALALDDENPDARRALRALDPALVPGRTSYVPDDEELIVIEDDAEPSAPARDGRGNDQATRVSDRPSMRPVAPPDAEAEDEPLMFDDDEPAAPVRAPSSASAARPAATNAVPEAAARPSRASVRPLPAVLDDVDEFEVDVRGSTIDIEIGSTSIETAPIVLDPIVDAPAVAPAPVAAPRPAMAAQAPQRPPEPADELDSTTIELEVPRPAMVPAAPPAAAPTVAEAAQAAPTQVPGSHRAPPAGVFGLAQAAPVAPVPVPQTAPFAPPAPAAPAEQPSAASALHGRESRTSLPRIDLDAFDLDAPISKDEFDAAPVADAPPVPAPAPVSVATEETLDEVDFYIAQGLFEEARELLADALAANPTHPLLVDKLAELDELEHGAVTTGASPEGDDDAFALAERLADVLDDAVDASPSGSAPVENIDVDQVLAQFKRGVEQQVDASDTETHYDLGIAYKEMGLLDDAVSEFEIAANNVDKSSIALTMIGLCRVEQGRFDDGIAALERALAAPHRDAREELGLCFELGAASALAGRRPVALEYFRRVQAADPTFRGVRERIAQLEAAERAGSADLAEDELERAFDDLIGG